MTPTKTDLVAQIADAIGVDPPPMSTGSTEPKLIFTLVNSELGLGLSNRLGKAELAAGIVEAAGLAWEPDFESRGATVTTKGLEAVWQSVRVLLAP